MSRIIVTGPKKVQENVIRELHRLKILHIVEHKKNELADIGIPLESSNMLSESMVKVRALISTLKIKKEDVNYLTKTRTEISDAVDELNEETVNIVENIRKIDEKLNKSYTIKQELSIISKINIDLEDLSPINSLVHFSGYLKNEDSVNALKKTLSNLTNKFMIKDSENGNKVFIFLFIESKLKEEADNILKKLNFSSVNFANFKNLKGTTSENLKTIENEISRLQSQKSNYENQLIELGKTNKEFLLSSREFLKVELEKSDAPLKFASTENAFLIKGWVPTEELENSVLMINDAGKDMIFLHSEEAQSKDNIPVKMNNENLSKPFEFFIDMYSYPKYKEIDPTFLMFFTYPIFFGFMLGDFGYGLVSLALFYLLKKKFPKGKSLFNILMISSISSIIFGLIFGEFFGFEELEHFHIPHLISRSHGMFELMYIAIGIGFVHVNMGLILGFINEKKSHGTVKAIFEKGSWFVLQIGIALLTLTLMGIINLHWAVGAIFFVVSVIMLYKGEGVKGLIELPSILTNILSYIRLMAIGLSSVSIAVVVNEMAEGFFHEGGTLIIAGILIMLVGHVLNIVLGLFGSFLHSLRLHYVEFFSKFFQGGAEKFRAFGSKD